MQGRFAKSFCINTNHQCFLMAVFCAYLNACTIRVSYRRLRSDESLYSASECTPIKAQAE